MSVALAGKGRLPLSLTKCHENIMGRGDTSLCIFNLNTWWR